MSKVLGIIAEYNPFHNGHLHHILESKKVTKSNYTIGIISGNFTQRGSTALIDKWSRAKVALDCGIDLVIELPVVYATSSAENFAEGAIKILNSLKVVDYVSFGSETDDIDTLNMFADILHNEPKEYKQFLADELNKGLSFPKARENALILYLGDKNIAKKKIISSPNNILGIEYIKALKKFKSSISPIAIPRYEVGHNENGYVANIASSTAIRNMIKNNSFNVLQKLLPPESYSVIIKNLNCGHVVPDLSVFEKQIIYNLRQMTAEQIALLPDVSEGLQFSIKKTANSCNSLSEFLNIIKTKRYTSTRIQRILLSSLLGITKKDIAISKKVTPYIRVLGFNDKGKFLLSEISKANPKLPIVTSVKHFIDNNYNKNLRLLLEKDIYATNIYTIGYEYDSWSNLDFTTKIIKKVLTI